MCSETENIAESPATLLPLEKEALEEKRYEDEGTITNGSEIAIRVQNLSKCYQIYDKPHDRLKQSLYPRLQRLIGQPAKQYHREFWALRDVSFEVKKGETVGIIGRNGSGKSTLLQIICGTLATTSGNIETEGRITALLELGSGFNPEFTGRENVYMNGAVLGLSKEEIDKRFDTIASFADIGPFIDQPVKTYSSGMSVRLAFAVQAQVDPDILIVDEALSVGDIRFQNKCFRRFDELRENGCSILFVTHNLSQIDAFCESTIWLEAGYIKAQGKPATITRAYTNLMVHGLPMASDITQNKHTEEHEAQFEDEKLSNREKNWLSLSNCKNIKNPGMVKLNRFRIGFDKKFGLTEIESQPSLVTVELEAEFSEFVTSPLLGLGIFNNLNEPIIHFNSFVIWSDLDEIAPGILQFNFRFTMPPLRPGEYLITIGIDDGVPNASIVLCHVYDLFPFRVRAEDILHVQGGYVATDDAIIEMRTR